MDQITSAINNEELINQLTGYYQQLTGSFLGVLGLAVTLILLAFFSYRILRLELAITGAVSCGALGYLTLAPIILSNIQGLPEGIDFAAVIGIVCAILGWVLVWALHKVALFLVGAAAGFYAGIYIYTLVALSFLDVAFLQTETFFYIVCGVCALAVGIIFVFLFKPLYILATSLGGMVGTCYLLSASVFGASVNSGVYLWVTLGVGAVLGIIATVVQFKKASETSY